ncbi:AI-2E family transporter [Bacillaceae bacterium]
MIFTLLVLSLIFMVRQVWPLLEHVWEIVKKVATPFLISVIIAYLLHPVVRMLHRRGVPRSVAVLLIYVTFVVSVSLFLINMVPVFLQQLRALTNYLPALMRTYEKWLREYQDHKYQMPHGIQSGIELGINKVETSMEGYVSRFVDSLSGTLESALLFAVVPFIVFYLLKDMKLMQRMLLTVLPRKHRREVTRLWNAVDEALGNYIRGQLTVCGIVGLLAYLGYWLIGMPYPFVLAVFVAMMNVIPYLGPFLGTAPALLLALTVSVKKALLVIAVNFLIQIFEGNVISPFVVGRRLHMHPLLIILALLVGGEVGGIVGLILAVPVFAAAKVVVQNVALHWVRR